MTLALLLGWLLPFLVAWLLVSFALPPNPKSPAFKFLRLALSAPLAFAIGSITFYLALLTAGHATRSFVVAETSGLTFLAFALAIARRATTRPLHALPASHAAPPPNPWLIAAVVAMSALALTTLIAEARAQPHGNWDASSIWNLRARFLARGGSDWTDAFNLQLGWSHPDYPLLLPAAVARSWLYLGRETQLAPAAISVAATLTVVALLASAVAHFRDSTLGLLAALALLATDPLIRLGADQYADIPLAALMLATTLTLCIALSADPPVLGPYVLAGLFAGLAAWTKNEGTPFATIISAILLLRAIKTRRAKPLACFLAGLLPLALLVAHFKWRFAPPNDLLAASTPGDLLHGLLDPRRHLQVAPRFAWAILSFGKGIPIVLLTGALILSRRPRLAPSRAWLPAVIVAAMATTYYLIYIVTPQDIDWHMSRSATRLLLQIYPLALLAGFLIVRSPAQPASTPSLSPSA